MTTEAHRILLVDDDVDLVEMNRRILEAKGYCVEGAYNAQEALVRMPADAYFDKPVAPQLLLAKV